MMPNKTESSPEKASPEKRAEDAYRRKADEKGWLRELDMNALGRDEIEPEPNQPNQHEATDRPVSSEYRPNADPELAKDPEFDVLINRTNHTKERS